MDRRTDRRTEVILISPLLFFKKSVGKILVCVCASTESLYVKSVP